jgi:hypothetical protein
MDGHLDTYDQSTKTNHEEEIEIEMNNKILKYMLGYEIYSIMSMLNILECKKHRLPMFQELKHNEINQKCALLAVELHKIYQIRNNYQFKMLNNILVQSDLSRSTDGVMSDD